MDIQMIFSDQWMWLVFIGAGLLMGLIAIIIGVEAGYDLIFIGSAFIIGGLVTWPFTNWVLTLIITLIICIAYIVFGRRYVTRWAVARKEKTNIDTIIGKTGIVIQNISRSADGRVKVGSEEWKARSEETLSQGENVTVTGISGVTLTVEKMKEED